MRSQFEQRLLSPDYEVIAGGQQCSLTVVDQGCDPAMVPLPVFLSFATVGVENQDAAVRQTYGQSVALLIEGQPGHGSFVLDFVQNLVCSHVEDLKMNITYSHFRSTVRAHCQVVRLGTIRSMSYHKYV